MARSRTAYNSSDSPIVIDGEGHTIGGREHGKVDAGDPHVIAALERGALLLREDVVDPQPPSLVVDQAELDAAAAADAPAPQPPRTSSRTKPKE